MRELPIACCIAFRKAVGIFTRDRDVGVTIFKTADSKTSPPEPLGTMEGNQH